MLRTNKDNLVMLGNGRGFGTRVRPRMCRRKDTGHPGTGGMPYNGSRRPAFGWAATTLNQA